MITKEMAVEYLDRITEGKRAMEAPLLPDRPYWDEDQAETLGGQNGYLLVSGAKKLARALNRPAVLRSFSETADALEFHWNGYIIRDLYCGNNKRIKHIA